MVQPQNSIGHFVEGDAAGEALAFFFEIDLTSGYITEIVSQRSGDLRIEIFMRPSAPLHIGKVAQNGTRGKAKYSNFLPIVGNSATIFRQIIDYHVTDSRNKICYLMG